MQYDEEQVVYIDTKQIFAFAREYSKEEQEKLIFGYYGNIGIIKEYDGNNYLLNIYNTGYNDSNYARDCKFSVEVPKEGVINIVPDGEYNIVKTGVDNKIKKSRGKVTKGYITSVFNLNQWYSLWPQYYTNIIAIWPDKNKIKVDIDAKQNDIELELEESLFI